MASPEANRRNGLRGGRPKGSTTRPRLVDFYTKKELEEFIISLKEKAKVDSNIAKFIAEQIFGKAIQPMEGHLDAELIIKFDESITPRKTKGNSTK